jgi:hypothetical protein
MPLKIRPSPFEILQPQKVGGGGGGGGGGALFSLMAGEEVGVAAGWYSLLKVEHAESAIKLKTSAGLMYFILPLKVQKNKLNDLD